MIDADLTKWWTTLHIINSSITLFTFFFLAESTSISPFPEDFDDLHPLIPLYFIRDNRTERVLKGSTSTNIKTNTKFIVNSKPQDNYVSASTVNEVCTLFTMINNIYTGCRQSLCALKQKYDNFVCTDMYGLFM